MGTSIDQGRTTIWSGRPDSNRRHQPWQGCTLPTELLPRSGRKKALKGLHSIVSNGPPNVNVNHVFLLPISLLRAGFGRVGAMPRGNPGNQGSPRRSSTITNTGRIVQHTPPEGMSNSDLILWCFAGAMGIVLIFKHDTPEWTAALLVGLWLLVVIAAWKLVKDAQPKARILLMRSLSVLAVSASVGLFGWNVSPERKLGVLSESEQDKFITALKAEKEPLDVHLMCPPYDERDCIAGAQFIPLFERAGWRVKNRIVDRVPNGQPKAGFYFVLHSTVDPDPANPEGKTGAWTRLPTSYLVAEPAFGELIKTSLVVGYAFPEDELGIYFGEGLARQ
jgi:hypothetical protein